MAALRLERDSVLYATSTWAWRSSRQACAKKARELLESRVHALERRLDGHFSLERPCAPAEDFNSFRAELTDLMNAMRSDFETRLTVIDHQLQKQHAVLANLHEGIPFVAECLPAFDERLAKIESAATPELVINTMVEQAKAHIDHTLQGKLELVTANIETIQDQCDTLEGRIVSLSNTQAGKLDRTDVETLLGDTSKSIVDTVTQRTAELFTAYDSAVNDRLAGLQLRADSIRDQLSDRIDATQSLLQEWSLADAFAAAASTACPSPCPSSAPSGPPPSSSAPPSSTAVASASTPAARASIDYNKFRDILSDSSDDERPGWIQARDGPKKKSFTTS